MTCTKCGHAVPDDSVFCQYCGCKIEINTLEPPKESQESSTDEKLSDDKDTQFDKVELINDISTAFGKILAGNANNQSNFENDPEFGLVPGKPVYTIATELIDGEEKYLNSLTTSNGEEITWSRLGSTIEDGISGVIDIYATFLPSGNPYKKIYINMYGAEQSASAPVGFALSSEYLSAVKTHATTTPVSASSSANKNPRKKYCKRCGSEITGKKRCDICHQKKENNHKTVYVILSIIIAILLLGNITFGILLYKNHNNTVAVTQELSAKDAVIEKLESSLKVSEQKNQSMQESVDNYRLGFDRYNTILEACKNGNIGYASSKFHTDVSIVALNRLTTRSKITLTANYNTHVTISLDKEGNAADVDFDEDTWYGSTTSLTIKPKYRGVTIATFSNSINSDTFSIIIIVY